MISCGVHRYYFIWSAKVVSLASEIVRIVSKKVGKRNDVAVVGPHWWAKFWAHHWDCSKGPLCLTNTPHFSSHIQIVQRTSHIQINKRDRLDQASWVKVAIAWFTEPA